MSLKKEEIRQLIVDLLAAHRVEGGKIDIFVSELIQQLDDPYSELNFGKGLQHLISSGSALNNDYEKARVELLKGALNFRQCFLKNKAFITMACDESLRILAQSKNDEDLDGNADFLMSRFKKEMDLIIDVLESNIQGKRKSGAKKDISCELFTAKIVAMAECLLGLEAKVTNNQSDAFYSLMQECHSLAQGRDEGNQINLGRLMRPFVEDYETVFNVAYHYKDYGRLDLYIEYLNKTHHVDTILGLFDTEWKDWERPHNFPLPVQ